MKLHEKYEWGRIWYEAKRNNFKITIERNGRNNARWYFYLSRDSDDKRYNSLWDKIDYMYRSSRKVD